MSSFRLHSEDSEFNSRVDTLFSSLATAAVELEPTGGEGGGGSSKRPHDEYSSEESTTKRDGEFRRPDARPLNWRGRGKGRGPMNSTPDYVKNPNKWTRYSMKDTKVLSDRENKEEALRLFDKLRQRKETNEELDDVQDRDQKIVFKKPDKTEITTNTNTEADEKMDMSADALFGGPQKLKLAEYVVGKTKQKNKTKKTEKHITSEKMSSKSEVKLGHLMFDDEED